MVCCFNSSQVANDSHVATASTNSSRKITNQELPKNKRSNLVVYVTPMPAIIVLGKSPSEKLKSLFPLKIMTCGKSVSCVYALY